MYFCWDTEQALMVETLYCLALKVNGQTILVDLTLNYIKFRLIGLLQIEFMRNIRRQNVPYQLDETQHYENLTNS